MPGHAEDQDRVGVLHRPLQANVRGGGHRPQIIEVQHDQGKARAAGQQVGGAEGHPEAASAAHPEQRREIGPGRRGGVGIERVGGVHEGHLSAGRRDAGNEGQEQAAGSGGAGTDDLAEPARRKQTEQAVDPLALPPWRG